jgi:hypothetical protein
LHGDTRQIKREKENNRKKTDKRNRGKRDKVKSRNR